MKIKKITSILLTCMLVTISAITLVGCTEGNVGVGVYTYNSYTAVSPSNWNQLTYQDENDTQIMSYLSSSFFEFDYEFDAAGEIVPGGFEVEYSAAEKLEDVTSDYVGETWGIGEDAKNRAWKITLRQDLKWDDGTPIDARDFVYSMKEQLNPEFQNYRADSFYVGALIMHNAREYVYGTGKPAWFPATTPYTEYSEDIDSELIFSIGSSSADGEPVEAAFRAVWGVSSYNQTQVASLLAAPSRANTTPEAVLALVGKTLAEIKADADMKATWDAIYTWWDEGPETELDFFITEYTYPVIPFEGNVGMFVGANNYEIVLVLDNPLPLLNEDGTLSYRAAYNLSDLPLVKESLYEENKVQPTSANALWTSTYATNVQTSASWGPYKLTFFQSGKEYRLERNENWFGYNDSKYDGQYQTDRIICETISSWNTAWVKFLAGEIDGISILPTIAEDYKNSEQAYFTADDYVGSLQLQSSKDALKARETEGVNKTILSYADFRRAISLGINRADYTQKVTTSSFAGFGLYNSMHYYDVANAGVYRDTDPAKQVLCNVYGVNVDDFGGDLDAAVASITGYDLTQARAALTSAYNDALAAGDIKAGDVVSLVLGTSTDNESFQLQYNYLKEAFALLAQTTPLEGKLELTFAEFGANWANAFRDGEYDICSGGWSGAAWDPGYFLLAYLSPAYMYSASWNTSAVSMEFTMPGVGEDGADVTDTMSLMDWYGCLNSSAGAKYSWGAGEIPEEKRLLLIAALEEQVLLAYYTVPIYNYFSASLRSFKVEFASYEYNTFMAYGGVRYRTFNYDDAEWRQVVRDNNNELDYK